MIDKNTTVGIMGMGFVGGAICRGFGLHTKVRAYDVDPKRSTHDIKQVANCEFVFIAVPTPASQEGRGPADLSILQDALEASLSHNANDNTIFIIKSTIPPGTIRQLTEQFPSLSGRLVHSPEFLTERNADIDFATPARLVVGGDKQEAVERVRDLYTHRFPGVQIFCLRSREAELVKYMCNCFFAVKVTFFNEMRLLADELNMDWDGVLQAVLAHGTIARSHTDVPGHDGKRGYGGKCFPKDVGAMIHLMNGMDIAPHLLEAAQEQNESIRMNYG